LKDIQVHFIVDLAIASDYFQVETLVQKPWARKWKRIKENDEQWTEY